METNNMIQKDKKRFVRTFNEGLYGHWVGCEDKHSLGWVHTKCGGLG